MKINANLPFFSATVYADICPITLTNTTATAGTTVSATMLTLAPQYYYYH